LVEREFGSLVRRAQLSRLRVLAVNALGAYQLGPCRIKLVQHAENTTYLVDTDADRYVLRIHRPPLRTMRTVDSELRWLEALSAQTDLAIPRPGATRSGELEVPASSSGVPDGRICVLFGWLPGRFLDAQLRPGHLRQAGVLAARLQEHARGWAKPADFRRPRQGLITEAARAAESYGVSEREARTAPTVAGDSERACAELAAVVGEEATRPVRQLCAAINDHRAELGTGPDVYGLQHGDLHQENYLFKDGRIGVIDFDDCGFGWYIDDLAVCASEIQGRPDTADLIGALLQGYHQATGVTLDRSALDLHVKFRYMQIAAWILSVRSSFAQSWEENIRGLIGAIGQPPNRR
jgi:Ser/Thr protein kinase RdoA (MazF antagonist)